MEQTLMFLATSLSLRPGASCINVGAIYTTTFSAKNGKLALLEQTHTTMAEYMVLLLLLKSLLMLLLQSVDLLHQYYN